MPAFWIDECNHGSETYIGSFKDSYNGRYGQYDVYIFCDGSKSDKDGCCIRWGNEPSEYHSPGGVSGLIKFVNENPEFTIYTKALELIKGKETMTMNNFFASLASDPHQPLPGITIDQNIPWKPNRPMTIPEAFAIMTARWPNSFRTVNPSLRIFPDGRVEQRWMVAVQGSGGHPYPISHVERDIIICGEPTLDIAMAKLMAEADNPSPSLSAINTEIESLVTA